MKHIACALGLVGLLLGMPADAAKKKRSEVKRTVPICVINDSNPYSVIFSEHLPVRGGGMGDITDPLRRGGQGFHSSSRAFPDVNRQFSQREEVKTVDEPTIRKALDAVFKRYRQNASYEFVIQNRSGKKILSLPYDVPEIRGLLNEQELTKLDGACGVEGGLTFIFTNYLPAVKGTDGEYHLPGGLGLPAFGVIYLPGVDSQGDRELRLFIEHEIGHALCLSFENEENPTHDLSGESFMYPYPEEGKGKWTQEIRDQIRYDISWPLPEDDPCFPK